MAFITTMKGLDCTLILVTSVRQSFVFYIILVCNSDPYAIATTLIPLRRFYFAKENIP